MNADRHLGLFTAAVIRSRFKRLQNLRQLISEENGDYGRRSLKSAQAFVIAGGRDGSTQQVLVFIHCLDDRSQEKKELRAFMRAVTGVQQIVPGICEHGPVVVLAASVHTGKRLFIQQADQVMAAGHLFHHFHGQLVMIARHIRNGIDRRHLMLCRSSLVVFCFGQDTQLPEFLIQFSHEGLNTGLDGAEEVIAEFLSLRRLCAEQRTAGKDQVTPLVE